MDIIRIKDLHVYAYHGVHDFEKENGQNFYICAEAFTDLHNAGLSDRLEDTLSYSELCRFLADTFTEGKYDLIETAAEKLAEAALIKFDCIRKIEIEVKKPEAPIKLDVGCVSVDITREWHRIYLSVGSNMGDRQDYINRAVAMLDADKKIHFLCMSKIYETKPYGGVPQDDFLNGVIEADTLYTPKELLDMIHETEKQLDRERKIHWGPRTLDLDILLYDDLILDSKELTIPHPDMKNRDFVLEPLNDLAPHLIHPVEKISIGQMLKNLNNED